MWWLVGNAVAATWVVGVDAPSPQEAVARAADGDTVELPAGEWPGPLVLDRPLTLRGPGTLRSSGVGDTLVLDAPGVVVEGVGVVGSGPSMDAQDSCVRFTQRATAAVLRGSDLSGCLFGVWVDRTAGARIEENTVAGRPDLTDTDRGNGIHTHDAERLVIRGNAVRDVRDGIYVAATEHTLIAENQLSHVRYGIHYMYSYDNEVRGNVTRFDDAGVVLMSSKRLDVHHNVATDNVEHGLLLREINDSRIHHNVAERNLHGMFLYLAVACEIHENVLRHNDVGAKVWGGQERNALWGNAFLANARQVMYAGVVDEVWGTEEHGGNYWSDHLGWDQDDDGLGDRPYRADAATAALLHRFPQAVLLLTSPTLELLRAMEARLPALAVPTVHDPRPLQRPPATVAPPTETG